MSIAPAISTAGAGWTCPFCSLLCEGLGLDTAAQLQGSDCPRALAMLAAHRPPGRGDAAASVDGAPVPLELALRLPACSSGDSRCSAASAPTWRGPGRCSGWRRAPTQSPTTPMATP
jgi:formylmethanofuran dehydrogenase subunit B